MTPEFVQQVRSSTEGRASVAELKAKATIEIRDLNSLTLKEEVETAIRKLVTNPEEDIKTTVTAPNVREQVRAFVTLSAEGAAGLIKAGHIKIGWIRAKMRAVESVARCYRCLGSGHIQGNCSGPDRKNTCIKCGATGHKMKDCKEAPKCILCTDAKLKEMPDNYKMLRVLQANMHRSCMADALLEQIAIEKKADVVIISEQYGTIRRGSWLQDETGTAAIWLPSGSNLVVKQCGVGYCYTYVRTGHFTIMSCYLTPSDSIEQFTTKLDLIEDKIHEIGGPFIVAGDFNAKAVEWGASTTNTRGRCILNMAARLDLVVCNTGGGTTFRRPGCEHTKLSLMYVMLSIVYGGRTS